MYKCINCGYEGSAFSVTIIGVSQGFFIYVAKCPRCSSHMTECLPGFYEADLRIGFWNNVKPNDGLKSKSHEKQSNPADVISKVKNAIKK